MKKHHLAIALLTTLFALGATKAEAQWGATIIDVPNGKEAVLGTLNSRPYAIVLQHDGTCVTKRLYDRNGHWGNTIFHDHEYIEVATTSFEWCGRSIQPLETEGNSFACYLGDGAQRTFVNQGNPHVIAFGGDGDDAIVNMVALGGFSDWTAGGGAGNDLLLGVQGGMLDGEPGDDLICIVPGESAARVIGGDGGDALCGAADATETLEWHDPNCSCFG